MGAVLKCEFKLVVPAVAEPAQDMVDGWATQIKGRAETINDRRIAKVPDAGAFNTKLAVPSSLGYSKLVDDTFVNKSDLDKQAILDKQAFKLTKAFNKWDKALNYAFETVNGIPASRFKDAVDNKKGNWADGASISPLPAVGDKIRGLSATPIAAYILTGDDRATGMIRPADYVDGTIPYNVALVGQRPALRAGLVQLLTQCYTTILYSNFREATITAQNARILHILNGLRDEALADEFKTDETLSFLKFILVNTTTYLHGKVVLTPT